LRLFVLGAPRSGTTLVGNFIASHPVCCDLGEYFGFYVSLWQVPQALQRAPSRFKAEYLEDLFDASLAFADRQRDQRGARFWCDQTPFNLSIAQSLATRLKDAIFVLMLRHYRGAIQSLRRSYTEGYRWAGRNFQDSATLWANIYHNCAHLPPERTIAVSYERLCAFPLEAIESLEAQLAHKLGIESSGFDRSVCARSYATTALRRTIAFMGEESVEFKPIASYDSERWTEGMETAALVYASETDALLRNRYPDVYREPLLAATATR
jgi:hypothetical protein